MRSSGFGTEADQPVDALYEENRIGGGHAGHPGRCPSPLLRSMVLSTFLGEHPQLLRSRNVIWTLASSQARGPRGRQPI
jgi:hypothetical protein